MQSKFFNCSIALPSPAAQLASTPTPTATAAATATEGPGHLCGCWHSIAIRTSCMFATRFSVRFTHCCSVFQFFCFLCVFSLFSRIFLYIFFGPLACAVHILKTSFPCQPLFTTHFRPTEKQPVNSN